MIKIKIYKRDDEEVAKVPKEAKPPRPPMLPNSIKTRS
jgi:hypothetical protein